MANDIVDVAAIQGQLQLGGIRMVGQSAAFLSMIRVIRRMSASDATVLIEGETGTGKELAARSVHYLGPRRAFPFVAVNCGALPDTLVENELFGHHRGAFTDAQSCSPGLLRLGARGTVFLDEIEALPPRGQIALLRFLQDGRFRPLGARCDEASDARIIAASNVDLPELAGRGLFRLDLYHRLNLLTMRLPPLRARERDTLLLASHFLAEFAQRYKNPPKRLHARTLEWFQGYEWPGNVRELENLIHREFVLSDGDELLISPPFLASAARPAPLFLADSAPRRYREAKAQAVEAFNREYLSNLLSQTHGNVTHAAKLADKERRAFGKLLRRYGIRSGAPPGDDISSMS